MEKEVVPNAMIRRAVASDADNIARMVIELLEEVMRETHMSSFDVNADRTRKQAKNFIEEEKYIVFLANRPDHREPLGFLSLCECCALYAGGVFGIIPECYVCPEFRSLGIGGLLITAAKDFGKRKNWSRLEVTTPLLPTFQRTLDFYDREGFELSGGKKLKVLI